VSPCGVVSKGCAVENEEGGVWVRRRREGNMESLVSLRNIRTTTKTHIKKGWEATVEIYRKGTTVEKSWRGGDDLNGKGSNLSPHSGGGV